MSNTTLNTIRGAVTKSLFVFAAGLMLSHSALAAVTEDIDLDLDGSEHRTIRNIDNDNVTVHFSGSSHLRLKGKTHHVKIKGSGSGTIDASDLEADTVDVDVTGSSTID